MAEATEQPATAKTRKSLTGFYVAVCGVIALGLLGFWLWRAYTVWWFDADEAKRRQAEAAAKLGVPVEKTVDLGDGVKLELLLIPAGRFKMGSPADEKARDEDEMQHWVVITRPFYIGKYEVTQEQWEKVMGTNPCEFKGVKNPVSNVSWNSCQEFGRKLNGLGIDKGQFRLPTEAEWEWACRAGTRTRFCSGAADEVLADYAWFDAAPGGRCHPVGMRKPNAWGLHDMHGNVWEWCEDWYDRGYYAKSPRCDPTGPVAGAERVSRGGAWCHRTWFCRSSQRAADAPTVADDSVGFRLVLVPAEP
ncbi:MAG TPA: formylglycine-generating enzyme family protein [Planctomycetota bacterium]|nr:formylglycine-generating enzyme family protein [Planctomycetota bacterium]